MLAQPPHRAQRYLRRSLLAGCFTLAMQRSSAEPVGNWQLFRTRCITADGRVIDAENGGVSHSEGQGWGMLFAVAFDDRRTFDRILNWTAGNLRRPRDALHAWRYDPTKTPPVGDMSGTIVHAPTRR